MVSIKFQSNTKFNRRKYFLAIIMLFLGMMEFSVANKSCKSTVMKIVMKQCSNATLRTQRGPASETSTFEESAISWDYRRFPKTATLPVAQSNFLGFELTETELNELLSEIYERLGRNPTPENEDAKNKTKQLFLEIAARCCQNEAECLKKKIIECP